MISFAHSSLRSLSEKGGKALGIVSMRYAGSWQVMIGSNVWQVGWQLMWLRARPTINNRETNRATQNFTTNRSPLAWLRGLFITTYLIRVGRFDVEEIQTFVNFVIPRSSKLILLV